MPTARGPGSLPSTPVLRPCVGVPMTAGQADINAHGTGTTFCLSGKHNWTLTPKAGDKLVGPAILAGGNTTAHAIVATAPNVTLASLTIQHYNSGNGTQDGAIHIDDSDTMKATASGWRLANLDVGFNSSTGSGTGDNWTFFGGPLSRQPPGGHRWRGRQRRHRRRRRDRPQQLHRHDVHEAELVVRRRGRRIQVGDEPRHRRELADPRQRLQGLVGRPQRQLRRDREQSWSTTTGTRGSSSRSRRARP